METDGIRYSRFDIVKLLTTKNVSYLSAPPGSKVSPYGTWQVAGAIGDQLLCIKGNATIRIPASDVLKVVGFDLNELYKSLGSISDGEGTEGSTEVQDDRGTAEES